MSSTPVRAASTSRARSDASRARRRFASRRGRGTSDHVVLRREARRPPRRRDRAEHHGDRHRRRRRPRRCASRRASDSRTGPCTRPAATCWSQPTCADVRTAAMERALLVRHAESVFSARGLATGRVDVRCPLSARGEAQARALAGSSATKISTSRDFRARADTSDRGDRARGQSSSTDRGS